MPDPLEQLREQLQRESAGSDAKLRQFVREGLTEERLCDDWDQLRGAHRKKTTAAAAPLRSEAWRELLAGLRMARAPQMAGVFAALAVVLLFGWFALRQGNVHLRTPANRQFAGTPLPADLNLQLPALWRGMHATFGVSSLGLATPLQNGQRGPNDGTQVFDVHLEGRTAGGEKIVFSGVVVLTNAPGITEPRSRQDLRGALLDGEITVANGPSRHISQPFVP